METLICGKISLLFHQEKKKQKNFTNLSKTLQVFAGCSTV
jgi:hypothetical protein